MIKQKQRKFLFWLFPVAVLAAVYFSFGLSMVSGPSMEPTLHDGETVVIRKALAGQYYHRGDIAVIAPSKQADTYLIKRIVAVGGDTVKIQNGIVFVNGKAANEGYLPQGTVTDGENEVTVPSGNVYLLGDNRSESVDSRNLGCFSERDIFGIILWK